MEMIQMKDGTRINPAMVCQVPRCPHESSARIVDLTVKKKWKDLCRSHALSVTHMFKEETDVSAVWNELTMEDFDESTQEA